MITLCALFVNSFGMKAYAKEYTLNIKEPDDKIEQINASDINLKYYTYEEFKSLVEQGKFKRVPGFVYTDGLGVKAGVSFDAKLLREAIDKLSCLGNNNVIESKNPGFKYTEDGYVITDEVYGNKVNKNILYKHVVNAIRKMETSLDMEAIDCYAKPRYTSKSQKTVEVRDILNKYVSSKITYSFGENKEVLDGSIINQWLTVDKNFKVTIDEEKVKNYIDGLKKYNTSGRIRDFITSSGNRMKINAGDFGWVINTAKEVQDLCAAIKDGQTITKEPVYGPSAFVEIDLSRQHLWFYKNGSLIAHGDVVTGNVRRGLKTPAGIYRLKYKRKHAVLRGPGYAAPVTYWMPFNGGIGIHDATWRRKFGGDIYKTDGSHGCINCPYNLAKAIYENIEPGTLIICYY